MVQGLLEDKLVGLREHLTEDAVESISDVPRKLKMLGLVLSNWHVSGLV